MHLRLALLGDPVSHSRSPAMHRAALAEAGLEGDYETITADAARLAEVVAALRDGLYQGLNVTMPLKTAAARLSDRLTTAASAGGSVNALRPRDGIVEAHSTDVVAFEEIFSSKGFREAPNVLVLGAGGSARAALTALRHRHVLVSARSLEKARDVVSVHPDAEAIPWLEPVGRAVVVNATPIGMKGESLDPRYLDSAIGLIDLPYGDDETPAVRAMTSSERPAVDGIDFLARQAAASFEWWTGVAVDSVTLARAARNA